VSALESSWDTPRQLKNILYYDLATSEVNDARHVTFDDTTFDLNDGTPNSELLKRLHKGEPVDKVFDTVFDTAPMDILLSPFLTTHTFEVSWEVDAEQVLGMSFADCNILRRAFIHDINRAPFNIMMKWIRSRFLYSYVVSINGTRVFNTNDVNDVLQSLCNEKIPLKAVEIIPAPERKTELTLKPTPLHMCAQDIRFVASILHTEPGNMSSAEYHEAVKRCNQSMYEPCMGDPADSHNARTFTVNRLQTTLQLAYVACSS
jgi:hypothetical protein